MITNWEILGEAKRRWNYLWIVPIQSPPTAMRFRHRGRVLPQQRRGPPI